MIQQLVLVGMVPAVLVRDLQVLVAFPTLELSSVLVHLCPGDNRMSSDSKPVT